MLIKILAFVGVAVIATTSFVTRYKTPIDYDASVAKAYSEKLLENSTLPFSAGINVNGLEGEWRYDYTMKLLSDTDTYENIKKQGFDHIRIPVDFRKMYSEETCTFIESEISKFDKVIELAESSETSESIRLAVSIDCTAPSVSAISRRSAAAAPIAI